MSLEKHCVLRMLVLIAPIRLVFDLLSQLHDLVPFPQLGLPLPSFLLVHDPNPIQLRLCYLNRQT